MKNTCIVCFSQKGIVKKNKCNCAYCEQCLLEWCKEKISDDIHLKTLPCLNQLCDEELQVHQLNSMIKNKSRKESLQQMLLDQYFKCTSDIKPCPNQKCNGYGFICKESCYSNLTCQYCDYSWIDKDHLSLARKSQLFLIDCKSEVLSYITEFVNSKQCPQCEFRIIKNGGCNHMTCKKCNHYFCWECKYDLKSKDHDKICSQNAQYNDILRGYLLLVVFYMIGLYKLIYFLLLYNLWIIIPLLFVCVIFIAIDECKRIRSRVAYIPFCVAELILLTLIYPSYLLISQVHEITQEQYIYYNAIQWAIILPIVIIYTIVYLYKQRYFRIQKK